LIVLRPAERTFARFEPTAPPRQLALDSNALLWKRTGEFQDIAGISCERVTFEHVVPNPARALMEKLAGEPVIVSITGDAWIADRFKQYAVLLSERFQDDPHSFVLLSALQKEGFIMRLVIRSQAFNGREMERTVTRIAEGPLTADLFDVPEGFRPISPASIDLRERQPAPAP
jgi:hypothetical protein